MATDAVVKALVELAASMREEGLARLTYVGNDFEREAVDKVKSTGRAREVFETALKSYVDRLVKA